jgi:hypothetical protein
MVLYLSDGKKYKIWIDGIAYSMNLYSATPISNDIKLLSTDNFVLTDLNGVYLTVKESE